ncbi:MAG: triose-phosphate isomerase [Bdellovibrionota bacterium]|nr:triose-phosphate isomerase [Deltaproteobacteria bacterium]
MRKKIVIGNWKMNKTVSESIRMVTELKNLLSGKQDAEIVVVPPFVSLHPCEIALHESSIMLGAQNVSAFDHGAYTGEVSAAMLLDVQCEYVLVGHSERREIFDESNQTLNQKLKQVLEYEMRPVLCIGESALTRKATKTFDFLQTQLQECLRGFVEDDLDALVIAYEPIWAIGTGDTAEPGQIQEVHQFIRDYLEKQYSKAMANMTPILYGGSVNQGNADVIMKQKDVDGVLVGGASLDAEHFVSIVQHAQ